MEFEIEKNIPMPGNRRTRFPLEEMEVGDSFRLDVTKRASLSNYISHYCRAHDGMRFAIRKESEQHARCWRVA